MKILKRLPSAQRVQERLASLSLNSPWHLLVHHLYFNLTDWRYCCSAQDPKVTDEKGHCERHFRSICKIQHCAVGTPGTGSLANNWEACREKAASERQVPLHSPLRTRFRWVQTPGAPTASEKPHPASKGLAAVVAGQLDAVQL